MKLCVYAIAKNEEANAARWYESVREADAVVVLDTGSTDRTVEILRDCGCKVFEKDYTEEHEEHGEKDSVPRISRIPRFRFDVARNDALAHALETDCDVFLALDLDEFPDNGWCDAIRELWDPKVHTRGTYDLYIGESPIPGSMNWLHDRSWRWRYPCHEAMERTDGSGTSYHVSRQLNLRGVVKVRHPDVPGGHGALYLPLLRTRWEENKGDQDSAAYLLRELVGCGLYEEARSFGRGLDLLGLYGNPGSWALLYLADAFDQGGERERAKALLYHAWRLWPTGRTAPVRLATILCSEDDPAGAEAVLRRCIYESGEKRPDGLFLDNEDVWLWRALDWLGVAVYAQGRFAEARAIFQRALAGANTDAAREHIRGNIRFCEEKLRTEEHGKHEK